MATLVGDSSQVRGEGLALLSASAGCIQNLRDFVKKARAKCQECQITCFKEACPQLQDICTSLDQKDRLIVAGSGNVGKSTIANALLDCERFWPTAPACMTSRICEAHYDASSPGTPVPKEMVRKRREEFQERLQEPLQVKHPSPLLKPGVILVDLPGSDQEQEYLERLDEYMQCHAASSVVLLYVIDVKKKIGNPDRQFLQKLMKSPWMKLSQSLLLLVNKCDTGGGDGAISDEEAPDYAELLIDITEEASNYCTPAVFDLSMKDKRKNETALGNWQKVEADVHFALAQLKCRRLIECLPSLENVMNLFHVVEAEDERRLCDEVKHRLCEAKKALEGLEADQDQSVKLRAAEIRKTLEEKRDAHFKAILKAVPYRNRWVGWSKLQEVEKSIQSCIQVMVANDSLTSARFSEALGGEGLALAASGSYAVLAIFTTVSLAMVASIPAVITLVSIHAIFSASALFVYAYNDGNEDGTTFVDEYVRDRSTAIFEKVLQDYPDLQAAQEFDFMVDKAKKDLKEQEDSLKRLHLSYPLDAKFKHECSQLTKEFESVRKLCEETLGQAKTASIL